MHLRTLCGTLPKQYSLNSKLLCFVASAYCHNEQIFSMDKFKNSNEKNENYHLNLFFSISIITFRTILKIMIKRNFILYIYIV